MAQGMFRATGSLHPVPQVDQIPPATKAHAETADPPGVFHLSATKTRDPHDHRDHICLEVYGGKYS